MEKYTLNKANALDLFLPDSTVSVAAAGLVNMGVFNIRGKNYSHYRLGNLQPGTVLRIQLDQLPQREGPVTWFSLIALVVIILVIVVFGLYKKRRFHNEAESQNDIKETVNSGQEKESLMIRIAMLDDLREEGKIDEASYQQERLQLKEKLVHINE